MSECCLLGKFPKKYLYAVRNEKDELVQLYLSEQTHLKIQKLLKDNPEAKLTLKDAQ